MSDTPEDLLRLACKTCRWRPAQDVAMGVVEAHVETEHPEQVKDDGSPDVLLDMVVVCPRCATEVPLTRTTELPERGGFITHILYQHDCSRCHRTYRIKAKA